MGISDTFKSAYRIMHEEWADPRTEDYFLSNSILQPLVICTAYLFISLLGPKFMKNRQPFQIERLVIFYNIVQIILTGRLFIEAVKTCYWPLKYSLLCQPVGYGTSLEDMKVVNLVWYYYMLKVIDLLDTVFIVLRKKSSQLSVLHLYHHAGMIVAAWIGVRFVPGGQSVLTGTINCFVHVIMYMYYLLTILDKKYRSSWWKKHITQLQLGQFAIISLHHCTAILSTDCTYPKGLSIALLPFTVLLVLLFVNFYRTEYIKNKSE